MVQDAFVRIQKFANGDVTKVEIRNPKTGLLNTLSAQLETTQVKKEQDEDDKLLVVFFQKCKEKHSLKEWRANNISLCNIFDLEHSTRYYLELPKLKAILKESSEEVQSSYFIMSKKPWQGMSQYFSFNPWNNVYNSHKSP